VNLRTVEDLNRRLAAELAWRRKELYQYFSLVQSSKAGQVHLFIRGAVAVLYAHWEGFVKAAGEAYLEFVRIRRLSYKELAANFLCLAVHSRLQGARDGAGPAAYLAMVTLLTGPMTERAQLPKKNVINTLSNLNSEGFREIVATLGLEYRAEYTLAEKPIIDRLLELRNNVAHGGDFQRIELEEYEQLYRKVGELLVLFGNDVDNSAIMGRYRR